MAEDLQDNPSVIIVDEYSPSDIKEKLQSNTTVFLINIVNMKMT